ncbi:MAG: hypothetical protein Kow0098_26990 [Ignavibacteriaceae bacterium]
MISEYRKKFNSAFSQEKYEQFIKDLNTSLRYPTDFRVSETPVFLTKELTDELINACDEIIQQLNKPQFREHSSNAVPSALIVPNEDDHPAFLQIDFAICNDENGKFIPKVIELQGFPSLYGYQSLFYERIKKYFHIPEGFVSYFSGLNSEKYRDLLKEVILGQSDPENVVLMEIDPEKQKTRIDFAATEKLTGIRTVSVSDIYSRQKRLFYKYEGKEIRIERIYNRVIFDELLRRKLTLNFDITEPLEVQWAGHPNWFFRISKHTLPYLKGKYVPDCYFLSDLNNYPDNLSEYVLKPLYSFAGHGVEIDLSREELDSVRDKNNYILQRKVEYAPLIETPEGYARVEIRMMFIWKDKPILVNNLVRMSKGKMMGVDYNKNKTWVGSSIAFHPE